MKVHPLAVSWWSSLRGRKPKELPLHHLCPFLHHLFLSSLTVHDLVPNPFIPVSSGSKLSIITPIAEASSYLPMVVSATFPAQHFWICPVRRLCQDSSRQLAVSHPETQRMGLTQTDSWCNRITDAPGACSDLGRDVSFCCVCVWIKVVVVFLLRGWILLPILSTLPGGLNLLVLEDFQKCLNIWNNEKIYISISIFKILKNAYKMKKKT